MHELKKNFLVGLSKSRVPHGRRGRISLCMYSVLAPPPSYKIFKFLLNVLCKLNFPHVDIAVQVYYPNNHLRSQNRNKLPVKRERRFFFFFFDFYLGGCVVKYIFFYDNLNCSAVRCLVSCRAELCGCAFCMRGWCRQFTARI